ncbi:uncharacterized protein [Arachis hypogaea]|uniref:uncharacterized protein n=1 Tax=Arachis hypogaea TaxID=3818 RepID=UPI000DEC2D2E|nr:uncharacterized protein LOC112800719 isoform X1 [Arachis hypogaea]XP_025698872.1 uncharacterized protein LOC112800719 isoform X1 [Arachis hypogaea]QHO40910.1 uncharacterized protein DS421_5g141180 [Arachis hypogaea]QHO40911.1 uncharacterized protein DS421_5g141180 [Arachis hypogaea]
MPLPPFSPPPPRRLHRRHEEQNRGKGWSASDGCRGLGGRRAFNATAPTPRRYRRPHYLAAVELASVEEAQHRWFRRVSAVELVSTTATDHTFRERGCTNRSRCEVAVTALLGSPLWRVAAFPPPSPKVHHRSCWARRMLLWCRWRTSLPSLENSSVVVIRIRRRCRLRWLLGCRRAGSETAAVSVQSFLLRFELLRLLQKWLEAEVLVLVCSV